jgi:hypothetical protein
MQENVFVLRRFRFSAFPKNLFRNTKRMIGRCGHGDECAAVCVCVCLGIFNYFFLKELLAEEISRKGLLFFRENRISARQ